MWLDNATTEFRFDKEDELVGHVETLKQVGWHVLGKGGSDCGDRKAESTLNKLKNMTMFNKQKQIDVCRMGAMTALLAIMVKHPQVTIRHLACSTFAFINSKKEH